MASGPVCEVRSLKNKINMPNQIYKPLKKMKNQNEIFHATCESCGASVCSIAPPKACHGKP